MTTKAKVNNQDIEHRLWDAADELRANSHLKESEYSIPVLGVLPRTYKALSNATLTTLLRTVNSILGDIDGDGFGKVDEYFLGQFANEALAVVMQGETP